ncbi:MAG: bifunctional phosphoribosylaminoimidazolecarboxamide formyltransferase/IMP cyclohydrolase [bacterium]
MIKIKRALISVSDKTGLIPLASFLTDLGCEILSTGGTAAILTESGFNVIPVSDVTHFPEMLDGRVKTLHPNIHGGILAQRTPQHLSQLEEHSITPIDLVVVNLYPFEATVSKPNVSLEEQIENIDIGGPTMIRAAAKNYKFVGVIVNPSSYKELIFTMSENNNCIPEETSFKWAVEAFTHCAAYDTLISQYLYQQIESAPEFPEVLNLTYRKHQVLRYGENPHQNAAFYHQVSSPEPCIATARQLHGKELSFNNILDLNYAIELTKEFKDIPACIIIKHNTPCGVAISENQADAYQLAFESDTVSAFGGVVGFNECVTTETANKLANIFLEAIAAPDYEEKALEILKAKKDLRILKINPPAPGPMLPEIDMKKTVGGLLVQNRDLKQVLPEQLRVVTQRIPTDEEITTLMFAWKVCKHVKSNAIVLAQSGRTVGVGPGQTSRVESVKIAASKAGDKAVGSCLASDAFFPFPDGVEEAARAGVKAIIQPGGSLRDEETIKVADQYGMAMVFTGVRHFRH